METYNDILEARIGKVSAKVTADNYFPVVGDAIRLDATTKWGQTSEWQTQDSTGNTVTEAGNLVLQKDGKTVEIAGKGDLTQRFVAKNNHTECEVIKKIYSMDPQTLPYFDVNVGNATGIVRVGDAAVIQIRPANGYAEDLDGNVELRLYKENEELPFLTLTELSGRPDPDGAVYLTHTFADAADRGIYDMEVTVTNTEGISHTKRENKFITVTPKLCPRPSDLSAGYTVAFTYRAETSYTEGEKEFECRLWENVNGSGLSYAEMTLPRGGEGNSKWNAPDCSVLPAGTTLVLKEDPEEPKGYVHRLFLAGNKSHNRSAENGTPNFTREKPLVITHDTPGIMEWTWGYYGAMSFESNMRNIVFDGLGYGYPDTNTDGIGVHLIEAKDRFTDSAIFITNGTSDFEIYGVDVDGAGFAGISGKTGPGPNEPWYWRENGFEMKLAIHHCTFRNTVGEGVYLGFFYNGIMSDVNSSGETVSFHAHILRDLRLYRCDFIDNGYDCIQINNAQGVEVCYCSLTGCGFRRVPGQGSAFSCTMDGKVYNCVVRNNYNVVGAPFEPLYEGLEVFNCVLTSTRYECAWSLSDWKDDQGGTGETMPEKFYSIHNNTVKAANIANISGNIDFPNYTMHDNIFITERGDTELPGYFRGSGNLFVKADQEYDHIDETLKAADSANYDYRVSYDSVAVTSGKNSLSPFDGRGYKNWYKNVFHSGAYMGVYKDESVKEDEYELSLRGITLDAGAASTYKREVGVLFDYTGEPIKYRIGETADLSGLDWVDCNDWSTPVTFTLSEGYGQKKVYAQIAGANAASDTVSDSIDYEAEPIEITMTVNGGKRITTAPVINVAFDVAGEYTALQYMLSEDSGFTGATYEDYTPGSTVQFTLSSKGKKTIYGKIKADGIKEARAQAAIDYANRKAMIGIFNGDKTYYEESGMTGFNRWPLNGTLYDVSGEEYCQGENRNEVGNATQLDFTSPGDGSGVYPDYFLAHGMKNSVTQSGFNENEKLVFSGLEPGNYYVRVLSNGRKKDGESNMAMPSTMRSFYWINGNYYTIADYGVETFEDNWHNVAEIPDIVVGSDGIINFKLVLEDGQPWNVIPVNVIEIEKMEQ